MTHAQFHYQPPGLDISHINVNRQGKLQEGYIGPHRTSFATLSIFQYYLLNVITELFLYFKNQKLKKIILG